MKKAIKLITITIILIAFFISSLTYLIPSPKLQKTNYIEIYDNQNNLIYSELYKNQSSYININNLNDYTYNAFVSIEDKNFYKHRGFDIFRNIQSFFINLFSFSIKQGASTISQQYARNTLLSTEKTLSRKIKEAFYTIQIERKYSKDKILEGYLNSLYFGHGLTGIDNASYYYFNKSPYNLTIAESAMLAGLCNAPAIYSPKINPQKSISRQKLVLYQMLIQDYITPEEYQTALNEKLVLHLKKQPITNLNYYKDAVINQLNSLKLYTKENLQKGMKIYTNINYSITNEINELLIKYKPLNEDIQSSIVIMEPFTNKVLYLSGGFDYSSSSYNRATNSSRQIGSTIKPLIYSLALSNGFNPNTLLTSEETTFKIENKGTYSPKNPNNKYANDKIDMIQAISLSDNIYALKTLLLLGSENLVRLLNMFGIYNIEALPSLALGTINTSLLKLTSIYNTFASLGQYYEPSFIDEVRDLNDNILYKSPSSSNTILNETNTLILNQMLTSTFDSSLSSYLSATLSNYKPHNIYAAKSGTTNSDSYVIAYNPNFTIGIWAGTDSNVSLTNYTLSKQLFKEISIILEKEKEPSWYNTNYHTEALRYNPTTHTFDNSGNLYYFKEN